MNNAIFGVLNPLIVKETREGLSNIVALVIDRSQSMEIGTRKDDAEKALAAYRDKLKQMGVEVKAVDPRNTSRTCPCCGHVDKANRKTQSNFLCVDCGFSGLADHIAAGNIARRATVTSPNVSTTDVDFYQ